MFAFESLSPGYTKLRTADNRCIIVPNSVMAGQMVINVSDQKRRGSDDAA
ncbi:MAG TPA: mechanosensitive ion channel domain-containing protein [Tepidisphaeraceae bacterium]|nr:mechanosensitive ion channel domain-containing protein [Tepidisphaeraceae bacterium]